MNNAQDSDRYDMEQKNVSAGVSIPVYGAGSASASVSMSKDKMHSNYDAVQEQTGLFAGKGGFDVTVGEHTQMDGAVIASTADASLNKLDTGTLGFSDIENKADYKVEHQSVGFGTGGGGGISGIGSQLTGSMANSLLTGVNKEGHESSVTRAAVSEGSIIIQDKDKQQQDTAELSRDVENANPGLAQIFDKEHEQQRIKEAQLIGEIGNQAGNIARTQGEINALKKAREANPGIPSDKLSGTPEYMAEMAKWGTGSTIQRAIQSATAAVQGLAGGDLAKAIAGGSAPYIATVIKQTVGEENKAANLMAHAAVNAALALASGNNALAAATGAAVGEAMSMIAISYYGKDVSQLTESERQTVSALATLAAGLAGGLVGDSTASAVTAAQAGKTTVENNYLSSKDARELDKELTACKVSGNDCTPVVEKYIEISNKNSQELKEACTGGGVACITWEELIQGSTNIANDAHPSQIRLDEKLKDPDAAALVNYLNGSDLKFLNDNITQGDRLLSVISDPTSWPIAVMGGKAIIRNAVNKGKEQLIAVGVTSVASAGLQYGTTGEVKLSDVIGTAVITAVTAGKTYNPTVIWNAAGGYYQAEIKGDDPFIAALLSKAGASAGYATGNVLKVPMDKVLNPVSKQYEWVPTGVWTITKPVSQHPLPSVIGNMGDSVVSELAPKYLEKKQEAKK